MRSLKPLWFLLLVAAAAAAYYFQPWKKAEQSAESRFQTTAATRGSLIAKVTASGTLSALVTVQVGSQVSGRIKELHVDFNSKVKKGEVIAKIDPELFNAAMAQARANFAAAQGDLLKVRVQATEATRQYTRTKALAEQKLVAQAELDTAQSNAEVANASVAAASGRVAQAKASLNQAQVNLAYTTIASPIDGVVISRSVDVGQTVAASLQAPTLFVIAEDLRKMQVDTSVAEADIGKLSDGMPTTFTVDAYPQERFAGKVRQIRNAAQNVQNVITYDAVVDVANEELKLKPGMTANVTFVYAERNEVLVLSNAALRFRPTPEMLGVKSAAPSGGASGAQSSNSQKSADTRTGRASRGGREVAVSDRRTVWVLRAGKPVSVELKVGLTDGSRTEIVEGALHEGDLVITDAANSGGTSTTGAGGQMPMRRLL